MEQLPKIVHQRLAKGEAENHPDPNLLTAFAEKSLRERERIQVLEHLARCGDCREAVALAVPELESGRVAGAYSPSRWLAWPVLRWGALAACMVVVAAAISLRYRQQATLEERPSPAAMAESAQKQVLLQSEVDKLADVRPQRSPEADREVAKLAKALDERAAANGRVPETAAAGARSRDNRNDKLAASTHAQVAAPGPLTANATGNATDDAKNKEQRRQEGNEEKQKQEFAFNAAKASNEVVTVEAETAQITQPAKAPPSAAKDDFRKKEVAPKTSEPAAGRVGSAVGNQLAASNRAENYGLFRAGTKVVPRWTLTSEGTLLRSLDAGKTWQTIPVADKTDFRAVAAVGSEIWVGGREGALYHSSDAGEHWIQVKPSAGGQSLGADVIGLEFNDAQHGKLTTANGEVWTTADAGQSWQKH